MGSAFLQPCAQDTVGLLPPLLLWLLGYRKPLPLPFKKKKKKKKKNNKKIKITDLTILAEWSVRSDSSLLTNTVYES